MNCPYCGQEMALGYIQCRDGVYWSPRKRFFEAFSFLGRGSVSLENGVSDNARSVYAYRCGHCEKVIIDYSG